MKSYITSFFILSIALCSAQNKKLFNEKPNISDSTSVNDRTLLEQNMKDLEKIKSNSSKKSETDDSMAKEITVTSGIERILNYKVNRVWREDLYCLVCLKNYKSGKIA